MAPRTAARARPAPPGALQRRDVLDHGDVAAQVHVGHRHRRLAVEPTEGEPRRGLRAEVVVAVELLDARGRQPLLDAQAALEPAHRGAAERPRRGRDPDRREPADHQPQLGHLPAVAGERVGELAVLAVVREEHLAMTELGMPRGRELGQLAQLVERRRLAVGLDLHPGRVPDHRQLGVRADEAGGHALEPGRRGAVHQPLELERGEDLVRGAQAGALAGRAGTRSRRRLYSSAASRIPAPEGRSALRAWSQYQPGSWPGTTAATTVRTA